MKKIIAVFFTMLLLISGSVYAAEGTAGDYGAGMATKAGRGLWNMVSSPAEIPCTMANDMQDNAAAGFFTGFGKGTVFMLRRIVVGASEFMTFFMSPFEATIPGVCKAG